MNCKNIKKWIYIISIIFLLFLVVSNFFSLSSIIMTVASFIVCGIGFYLLFKCSKKNFDNIEKTGKENVKKVMDDIGIP